MAFWNSKKSAVMSPPARKEPRALIVPRAQSTITTKDLGDLKDPRLAGFIREGSSVGDSAMAQAVVFRCVSILAGACANLQLEFNRRVSPNELQPLGLEEPVPRIFRRKPNPALNLRPSELRRMLTAHALLRGNGYAVKIRSAVTQNRIIGLLPLHPDRVVVKETAAGSLTYTHHRPGSAPITYQQDDIFHLRGLTFDGKIGVSVLAFAANTIAHANKVRLAAETMLDDGAMGPAVLSHPNQLGDDAYKHLKESLEEDHSGAENTGKWLILEEDMKAEQLGLTAVDAQFLETIKDLRGQIAMFFGIPPHMIGDTDKSTSWGSGIEQQSIGFIQYTAKDWLVRWNEAIEGDFFGDRPDVEVTHNLAPLLRGSAKDRAQFYRALYDMAAMTPNEIRAEEGKNGYEGGDEYRAALNMATTSNAPDDTNEEESK